MKKKVNIKILIFSIISIFLLFIVYSFLKFSSLEFNEYIELSSSPDKFYFFEKRIEDNKIFYSHKGEFNNYIGEIILVRNKKDNKFMNNYFETKLGKISDDKLENKITAFLDVCMKAVKYDGMVAIHIEKDIDVEMSNDASLEDMLNNNMKINYVFQDKQKLYMVNVRKDKKEIIGNFSYNGEISKVKTPEELSKEEIENSYKETSNNLDNDENGVG